MKVTVCFGNIRVIVPCGNGDLLVTELIEKAIFRYKKAINKPLDYWVRVHSLKSLSDGGILDFGDRLSDVADDREQIIAIYEEQDVPSVPHNGGDGTSASSSVGTSSPDLFHSELLNNNNEKNLQGASGYLRHGGKNDVIITHNDLSMGSSLIVRRGSEPALNNLGKGGVKPSGAAHSLSQSQTEKPTRSFAATNKRWSAIASIDETKASRSSGDDASESGGSEQDLPPPFQRLAGSGSGSGVGAAFARFARDSARQSLASNNSAVFRWMEAQQRAEEEAESFQLSRADPVGGSGHGDDDSYGSAGSPHSPEGLKGELIEMLNEGGPLGIHVVPDFDESGRDMGLVIQGIEAGGRIYRDGRLRVQDRIVEINGTSLADVEFSKAQEVFKQALQTERIRLRVIRAEAPPLPKQPPPLLPRPAKKPSNLDLSQNNAAVPSPIKLEDLNPPVNEVSPTKQESARKKVPPVPPARHPSTTLSGSPTKQDGPPLPSGKSEGKPKLVAPTNTRKIGKKIVINLTKGPEGLGFSVTTRDNPAGGNAPIYIKNILPKGAAVKDGRLKSGDRLLEVNGIEMTGKSQAEAVSVLRNTKLGSTVAIVVSRQVVEEDDQFAVPRELHGVAGAPSSGGSGPLQPPERAGVPPDDSVLTSTVGREVISLDIPLSDSGSAGLGVSVKGKTSTTEQGTTDLGIFIKSVITGGAASKDGRLLVNDQLLDVNGENLAEQSNSDAMEALRLAMQREGSRSGFIRVVVGRRPGLATALTPTSPGTPSELRISVSDPSDSVFPRGTPSPGLPPIGAGGDASKLITPGATTTQSHTAAANSRTDHPTIRNPALDRVAGGDAGGIRNLSYMRATHDSMLESFATEPDSPAEKSATITTPTSTTNVPKSMTSSTQPLTSTPASTSALNSFGSSAKLTSTEVKTGDVIRIDESTTYQRETVAPGKMRPASTLGFSLSAMDPSTSYRVLAAAAAATQADGAPQPPDWLVEWDKQRDSTGSELSPTDQQIPFSRDAFGRQSMSEKRHGHLDPRISEFYKKLKETRSQPYSSDKRNSSDVGPTLGLKKSSSLESLQTAVQDATLEDGESSQFRSAPNRGMVRGRGCNDSFRAAVDRSYDGPNNDAETMETSRRARKIAVEEESSEAGSASARGSISAPPPTAGPARTESAADTRSSKSSINSDASHQRQDSVGGEDRKGSKKKGSKKEKDKGSGIFKGLGHMFRFGKHRKPEDEPESRHSSRERSADSRAASKERPHPQGDDTKGKDSRAKKVAREEHEKIQEQYRKLQEKQRDLDRTAAGSRREGSPSPHRAQGSAAEVPGVPPVPPSRAERIQQLRSEHQRRHRERQGQYPSDHQEELYEKKLQQFEQQRSATIEGYYSSGGGDHARRPTAPPGAEAYERPGSRLGYADPGLAGYNPDQDLSRYGDGNRSRYGSEDRYSHYQNLQEIQAQLARHEYYQQRYQQYLAAQAHAHAHHQAALAHSAHRAAHHQHTSLSASQLMPPPLPPRQQEFHPHLSQRSYTASTDRGFEHRPYPATEPRGNWTDYRGHHHHMLGVGGGQPRSLTPSLPHESSARSASPGRLPPRSASPGRLPVAQTPLSQVGYLPPPTSHPHLPPPAPLHASQHSYSMDYMGYDDRMALTQRQGAYGADSSQFGSLPRRSGRSQSSAVSEAARV